MSSFSVFHVDLCSQSVNRGPDRAIHGCSSLPSHARFWGLCRWGHDPFPGGRAARHLGSSLSCVLCGAPLGDLAHCLSECRRSPSRMVQSGLCLVGFRVVLGSSFLDLQSQVFSELYDSHPCTCLVCWATVRKIRRSLVLLSTSWVPRCGSVPSVPPLGGSAVSGSPLSGDHSPVSAVLHCLQLFPMGLQIFAVTRRFCFFLVPWGSAVSLWIWFLGNSGSTLRFQPVSFTSSLLSPCSLGCEALVSSRLC